MGKTNKVGGHAHSRNTSATEPCQLQWHAGGSGGCTTFRGSWTQGGTREGLPLTLSMPYRHTPAEQPPTVALAPHTTPAHTQTISTSTIEVENHTGCTREMAMRVPRSQSKWFVPPVSQRTQRLHRFNLGALEIHIDWRGHSHTKCYLKSIMGSTVCGIAHHHWYVEMPRYKHRGTNTILKFSQGLLLQSQIKPPHSRTMCRGWNGIGFRHLHCFYTLSGIFAHTFFTHKCCARSNSTCAKF